MGALYLGKIQGPQGGGALYLVGALNLGLLMFLSNFCISGYVLDFPSLDHDNFLHLTTNNEF